MIYLFNTILSSLYLYLCEKNKIRNRFINYIPLIFLWTLIIGGQYDVGTDYFSYLKIFTGEKDITLYKRINENIFYYFVVFFSNIFSEKQYIFFLISFIENILFFCFILKIRNKNIIEKLYGYIFLYLVYSTVFYNQMNGIRQYFNVYILTLILFYLYENKILYTILLFSIGINIHRSFKCFIFLPFLTYFIKKINIRKILKILLIVSGILIIFIPMESLVRELIKETSYSNYTHRIQELSFQNKITKIIFIPFYMNAVDLIEKFKNRKEKLFFLKAGILCFILRILLLSASIVHRFGEYFGIITIFPIYYLIEEYYKNKKYFYLFILLFLIIGLFIAKVLIFPRGEYLYKTWFFR